MATEPDAPIDLRSLETVSEFSGHLMCAVCHCPFIRPIRLRCDHIFCQACLDSCINTSQTFLPFAPPPDSFHCPACRAPTDASFQSVPRLVLAMCDEILVKCPYMKEGCEEIIQRGHVQTHVDKYCDFRLITCPDEECDKKTRKKDLDPEGKCRHVLQECEVCGDSVMEIDLEAHATKLCPKLETTCPDCEDTLPLAELERHTEDCPKATRACQGAPYGCKVKLGVAEIEEHEASCTLSTLGPYLDGQSSRLASMESTVKQLQQRNQTLEDGISSIQSTLSQTTPRPLSATSVTPSSQAPHDSSTQPINTTTPPEQDPSSTNTPSSSTTTYLLSLHESLREEVSRLSTTLNNVDARATMSIMNENLRIREDMAHVNAGLNTVRMQVHMLMNQRLHQSQRADPASHTPGPSRVGGAAASMPEPQRGRRLSDSGREGTKL